MHPSRLHDSIITVRLEERRQKNVRCKESDAVRQKNSRPGLHHVVLTVNSDRKERKHFEGRQMLKTDSELPITKHYEKCDFLAPVPSIVIVLLNIFD